MLASYAHVANKSFLFSGCVPTIEYDQGQWFMIPRQKTKFPWKLLSLLCLAAAVVAVITQTYGWVYCFMDK